MVQVLKSTSNPLSSSTKICIFVFEVIDLVSCRLDGSMPQLFTTNVIFRLYPEIKSNSSFKVKFQGGI